VQKLQQELDYENQENAAAGTPEFVKEFTSHGVWSIEDSAGQDEVALSRKFGQETCVFLCIAFSEVPLTMGHN
jgi:complement component 1 Q subcomponent-binding protein